MPRDWLIVGADGGIGSALAARLPDAVRTSRRPSSDKTLSLDLAASADSWVLPAAPSVAFLCAARCSLEDCRKNPAETRFVNVEQTVKLAEILAARGAFVVFLSTNQVFDGSVPLREAYEGPCPQTEYGRQKADAERAILALGGAVVRFTKVYAGPPSLFRTWADSLRRGEPIEPIDDLRFSPVPLGTAVDALIAVGRGRCAGITQVSGEADLSYTDIARLLAERLHTDPGLVRPVSAASRGIAPEAAPRFTTLNTTRLQALNVHVPPVRSTVEGLLMTANCHICRTGTLNPIAAFPERARVTSDAKPFARGGCLAVCESCGTVQKPITPEWQAEADAIYSAYTIYHNAGGAEQNLFTGGGGLPKARSFRLLQQVRDRIGLAESGRMMDLGCGNGAMLRSFGELMPGWSLVGNELSDKYRAEIESIPHVEALYAGEPEGAPGAFDVLTAMHLLEHVPDPVAYLRRVATKLNSHGVLIAQVPDFRHSAFDLAVADHCTHFTPESLRAVFEAAGLEVIAEADHFVAKELTMVGRAGGSVKPLPHVEANEIHGLVQRRIAWLADLAQRGHDLAERSGSIGVFGTSVGGAWLLAELGASVSFFVDEDPAKIGKTWDGRPIVCPDTAPDDVPVLIGLPHPIAASLKTRLDELKTRTQLHLPRVA